MNNQKKVLVTGAAGFIGMHTSLKLLKEGFSVIGIDNLNNYYDVSLKYDRLNQIGIIKSDDLRYNHIVTAENGFSFVRLDISDLNSLESLFETSSIDYVIHLAAQAGVRHSITHPSVYIESNIIGFFNILELCRGYSVKHLLFASSSSVYGNSSLVPFDENQNTDSPVSLYAATKKSNEVMAHVYSHLYNLKCTGLRFFTVYGPWGRPDMAYFKFANAISEGKVVQLYNHGKLRRDFTYIDDVVESLFRLLATSTNNSESLNQFLNNNYKILNIGNSNPEELEEFVKYLEIGLGKQALIESLPMQAGDVYQTYADTGALKDIIGYQPTTNLSDGLDLFTQWFKDYKKVNN
jgi:UDP-glucuronate 4-epimerase